MAGSQRRSERLHGAASARLTNRRMFGMRGRNILDRLLKRFNLTRQTVPIHLVWKLVRLLC